MKAIITPTITGEFMKKCFRLRKKAPWLYWPLTPFLALFILTAWLLCTCLWRVAWQGFALCAWMGIDLERR